MEFRKRLSDSRRIVVKVGTNTLTDEKSKLDTPIFREIVDGIMKLVQGGKEVILVTSGAIGAGIGQLGLDGWPEELESLQAAAAAGQAILMEVYEKQFEDYDQSIAQMLLTREDFMVPERRKNFKNTLEKLFEWKIIPIINENDSVAVEEIRIGDNDILSSFVATEVSADLLIMLSDVGGLYPEDPNIHKGSGPISTVKEITPELEKSAGVSRSGTFGGMKTKLQAAKKVTGQGIPMVIADGRQENVLKRVINGEEIGTIFLPKGE